LWATNYPANSRNTTVNGKDVSYQFNTPAGIGDDLEKNLPMLAIPLPVAQARLDWVYLRTPRI
jgi:hypothetical protein